jgi:hypothetical protein
MEYISTDESGKYDIKHGTLTESPVRGSTSRFIANPIVDDIAADPEPKGRTRRKRVNGRVTIDTTVPDGNGYRYDPPSRLVVGEPSVNDLATHRWHNHGLSKDKIEAAKIEAQIIRRIQDGVSTRPPKSNPGRDDERAFRQLLEAFQRTVVKPAGKHIPGGGFYRRQPEKQKHTNQLLYEDLTSVGCFALWQSTLKFDPDRGYRFSTLSRHKIISWISNEANYLRQGGYTSGDTVGRYSHKKVGRRTQSRLDRWIFDHLGSPPEDLLEAQKKLVKHPVFHSLQEAADALKRANNLEHPDVYSDSGDDDIERDSYSTAIKTNTATEPPDEYRDVYQSQDPLYWSPQLAPHRDRVSPIVDFWIKEFCDPPRIKAKPNPKPIYKPCTVKPTGRVVHPIDKPYWMQPREKPPDILERKPPYDPDRREVATVKLKNGKTKRQYRQMRARPDSDADMAWRKEYGAKDWHSWMTSERKKRNPNVGSEPNQADGSATAEIIVLESRAGRVKRLHIGQRHLPEGIGERFACEGTAG